MCNDRARGLLLKTLREVVGRRHVLTADAQTGRYVAGYRFGGGPVLGVVRPGTLVELWRTLQACVKGGVIVIMQAANTGLTGGSTPYGRYDQDVILINTLRIKGVLPISEGRQVVCLPGATLYELEAALEPLDREPHSVIGSSCIGASVFGGICNNSGGALVQRGPAYTELALYARVDEGGALQLVNHLGIRLGSDPEHMLRRLEQGAFSAEDVEHDPQKSASDRDYGTHVRKIDEATPARFNADPRCLFEASGSAGRVALFAARLDTFPKADRTATFYIGTNDIAELTGIRRDILQTFPGLPIAGEYIHREAFDLAARYGKDTVIAIERLGTARLPVLFALKARVDQIVRRIPLLADGLGDRVLQRAARLFRNHLPDRMWDYHRRYEHHLLLKVGEDIVDRTRAYLKGRFPSPDGDFFECSEKESSKAFLHRFAVAGAAIRYRAIHREEVDEVIALDVALRRNDCAWFEELPREIDRHIVKKLYYGHFFCHVFHQDYIVAKGADIAGLKRAMLEILDQRGAEYPAEHNVGHLYDAKPSLIAHYQSLDPCNRFNPGIGRTPRGPGWSLGAEADPLASWAADRAL